jgi:hypothetical protein
MTGYRDEPDLRPWERPGAVRRDCEPHRADWLHGLGVTALVCAGFGGCLGVPAAVGLILGAAVWLAGRRDRALMRAGQMNPAGEPATRDAQSMAALGATLCLLALAGWAAFLLTLACRGWSAGPSGP